MGSCNFDESTGVSVSVVSHGQMDLVQMLLADIAGVCYDTPVEVILTQNLPQEIVAHEVGYPFPLTVIHNKSPMGFGANHNQAFSHSKGKYFCILNPDVRFAHNPFPALIAQLAQAGVALVAPQVLSPEGVTEDSARRFPTPLRIVKKLWPGSVNMDYVLGDAPIFPEWVAGMFMLLTRERYLEVNGFDPRYFLYYEDVDLCARLRERGYSIALVPEAKVIHQARRSSHRELKYLRWHLGSMLRFFLSQACRKLDR